MKLMFRALVAVAEAAITTAVVLMAIVGFIYRLLNYTIRKLQKKWGLR